MSTTGVDAPVASELHPLLAGRWSPRAFDPTYRLPAAQVGSLLEAARWAPSASNTQPWRFVVAECGSAYHTVIFNALAEGNRKWAGSAPVLIVVATQTVGPTGAEQPWARYDAGQASAHLTVQAESEGLSVHQMGGFDKDRIAALLNPPGRPRVLVPLVVMAVGRLPGPDAAVGDGAAAGPGRPRTRLPIEDLLVDLVDPAEPADQPAGPSQAVPRVR